MLPRGLGQGSALGVGDDFDAVDGHVLYRLIAVVRFHLGDGVHYLHALIHLAKHRMAALGVEGIICAVQGRAARIITGTNTTNTMTKPTQFNTVKAR